MFLEIILKLLKILFPQGLNNKDYFFYSILFAVRYQLIGKFSCDDDDDVDEQIKVDIGAEIFDEIYTLKNMMRLDLDILNFENQGLKINQILNKNNLFLRVFELKEKYRCLIKQDSEKKILSEISQLVSLESLMDSILLA